MRLIDADEIMPSLRLLWICGGVSFGEGVKRAEEIINNAPTIEAEPVKHGRWEPVTNGRGGFECSICHSYAPSYQNGVEWLSLYCPNCGARMDNEG